MQDHSFKFHLNLDLDLFDQEEQHKKNPSHAEQERADQQKTQHSVYTSLII